MKSKPYTEDNYNIIETITLSDKYKMVMEFSLPTDHKVFCFLEFMKGLDLSKYLKKEKDTRGRKGYDLEAMLKIVLYAYIDEGQVSYSKLEKLCKETIPYILIANGETPSANTFCSFVNNYLVDNIDNIFFDIVLRLIEIMCISTAIMFIDGTKFESVANKYTFVWKKCILTNQNKLFKKITSSINEMRDQIGLLYDTKESYTAHEIGNIAEHLMEQMRKNNIEFVYGRGHKKSALQKCYDTFLNYFCRLDKYEYWLAVIGDFRNSCSKTDHDATMCALKMDYYCNTGLSRPAYNAQVAVADGIIVNACLYQTPGDTKTFIPFMERYHEYTGEYPLNPVADAAYGSLENYMYSLSKGMNPTMKYGMYAKKNTPSFKKKEYNPMNWETNSEGFKVCPNGHVFDVFERDSYDHDSLNIRQVYTSKEKCKDCPFRQKCLSTKKKPNPETNAYKTVSRNVIKEQMEEVVDSMLGSGFGEELKKQRSVQAEGTFGSIKQNIGFTRFTRKGLEKAQYEFLMICISHNFRKYYKFWLEERDNLVN